MFKSKFLQECEKRGFLNQCTNIDELDKQLASGESVIAYWGTDPTGASLHVGHLFSLMMIRLFQRCGNKPIILVGGATGQIGDPSFKDKSRPMMSLEILEKNKEGIKKSISKFIKFGDGPTDAILVDNLDWWKDKNYLEVLRDIGPHVSVNRMLSFESVKLRLEKEEHMSFLEFNYMILQAYDFYHLYKKHNCTLQLCGGDQWGNVVAGVELVRKLQFINNEVEKGQKTEVLGFSTPLLTDANGKKIGKSEGNAIWTNEDLLDPFDYFQYFRNVNDADVVRFLKVYTDFEIDYIESIKDKDINELKKILAFEATKICHGEAVANECLEKAKQIFENNSFEHLEVLEYQKQDDEILLYFMLKDLNLVESNSEAKRLIKGGSIKINDEKIADEFYKIPTDLIDFKLSIGKKKHYRINIK
ncbi:MAG: tyrosine--tRNA ligase [Rickettsiales bacterium]|nr:tyrosine--tRNA ligase [Rickettsiales bacterium]